MTPIHELLKRIRWDPEFGRGQFQLGYWDRVAGRVLRVPLEQVASDPADHFALRVLDDEGYVHGVPFHRVVEVYKDGRLIWQRPHRGRTD